MTGKMGSNLRKIEYCSSQLVVRVNWVRVSKVLLYVHYNVLN